MARPVKTIVFRPETEDAAVYLRRTWDGPALALGAGYRSVVAVTRPDRVTVPLGPHIGPITRENAAAELRRAAPRPVDVFLVEVESPSGKRRWGMVAVRQATTPQFGVW